MPWLKRQMNHAGRENIERALKAADLKTCGEIVPVIARRSARYGHTPWLAAALFLASAESVGLGMGGPIGSAHLSPLAEALAWALLCIGAGWFASRFKSVRRILTPHKDRIQAVHRAAEATFHRLALYRARGDAGVLIYVSVEEREAVVLAGAGIADLAGAEHWKRTCALVVDAAARGDLSGGIEMAVTQCALVMAPHHPPQAGGQDVVLHQRLKII